MGHALNSRGKWLTQWHIKLYTKLRFVHVLNIHWKKKKSLNVLTVRNLLNCVVLTKYCSSNSFKVSVNKPSLLRRAKAVGTRSVFTDYCKRTQQYKVLFFIHNTLPNDLCILASISKVKKVSKNILPRFWWQELRNIFYLFISLLRR